MIKTVGIVGMGALGLMYGKIIRDGLGKENLFFIMDEGRYEKYSRVQYRINGRDEDFCIKKSGQTGKVDLLIISVKYPGLESALRTAEAAVGEDTVIISFMNGISSEKIIGERFGREKVLLSVAQGMDAMHFDNEVRYTKMGQVFIGVDKKSAAAGQEEKLKSVTEMFEKIGFPYVEEEDILLRVWRKFMLNVGVNQVCMVYEVGYGKSMEEGSEARMALIGAMRETILVGNAEGIPLCEEDVHNYMDILKTLDPNATPSMGQDRINRKPSEVDAFAGEIIRLGKKHGIYTPANDLLKKRVEEIEKEYI